MKRSLACAPCLLPLALFASACGSGGNKTDGSAGSGGASFTNVSNSGATYEAPLPPSANPDGGFEACPPSAPVSCGAGWCCPAGQSCVDNPSDQYHCGTDYCCITCGGGLPCGGGCCSSGTACTANTGNQPGCTTSFCCETLAEDETCPANVALQCPDGTTCRKNHSARACTPSAYACYRPAGNIGCPGEVSCPNSVDFCPAGDRCGTTMGVCPMGSTAGNYCCMPADPCGVAGNWSFSCPDETGCGLCPTAFAYNINTTISEDIAFAGGDWDGGDRTYHFNKETCTLTWDFPSNCGSLPATFNIMNGTGTGQSTFGCWNTSTLACSCTLDRPNNSCTATRF